MSIPTISFGPKSIKRTIPAHVEIKEQVIEYLVVFEWFSSHETMKQDRPDYTITKEYQTIGYQDDLELFRLWKTTGQNAITSEFENPFGQELYSNSQLADVLKHFITTVLNRMINDRDKKILEYTKLEIAVRDALGDLED